jgi:hypothetical protein
LGGRCHVFRKNLKMGEITAIIVNNNNKNKRKKMITTKFNKNDNEKF